MYTTNNPEDDLFRIIIELSIRSIGGSHHLLRKQEARDPGKAAAILFTISPAYAVAVDRRTWRG